MNKPRQRRHKFYYERLKRELVAYKRSHFYPLLPDKRA